MDELERIVRTLATPRAWVYDSIGCQWCGALCRQDGTMDEPHDDDCPFGLAIRWVETNPA